LKTQFEEKVVQTTQQNEEELEKMRKLNSNERHNL
jgi:chromosome segregation ATPase